MSVVEPGLRLSAQRALLGAIYPEIRLVKVKKVGSTITITTVADRELSESSADALSIAATEIIADFPECDLDEQFVVSSSELPDEDILAEGWVFQRGGS